ncbi:Short chain dehydrogenase sirS [Lasiodiplodia hormozganensis]|uniref:Short chain dehydrogenase sirS n=1 Tax=Lasiodiplodia hormozganensis TaxID=869390 RepID=A0AA39Y8E9_9PEZI|nr:Short chain dehydrogenase sirS [Lasiodiplodia hormozganensis]
MSENHALVFGASGLAGWAVVDELLSNYPAHGTFRKVTALVNRPLKLEDSWWPAPSPDRPELELIAGVNLLNGSVEEFTAFLKDKVKGVDTVTHVFYFAYKQEDDWSVETRVNTGMFERVVGAVDTLARGLKFFVFPSGTRGYGIHVPGGLHKAPLVETMDPLPEPYRSNVFYYNYQSTLRTASADKPWTWAEIRPDAIIGFSPTGSTYNLTAHWATYLSAFALVHGRGARVPFPGTAAGWADAPSNDASSAIIARAAIWASLHPDVSSGQLFNIADEEKPLAMSERWPRLAAWFGLEGVGPASEGEEVLRPGKFVERHKEVLERAGVKGASVWQAEALDTVGECYAFDRRLGLGKIRAAGFVEERDAVESWWRAFERFREAGMIV